MSVHAIEQALFDIASGGERAVAYCGDPSAFLAAYPLTDDECRLIQDMDVRRILAHGINPMLAMRAYTAVEGRQSVPEYMRRIRPQD